MQPKTKAKITFISAGAGSGKTHRLTDLLHHELTAGGVRPSGVIATTFTKKAAAELRERVREHLLTQGNFRLANAMGQARIGTVNSVCGQLIARFAFEAGVSTDQQVLEEVQAGVLLGKAIDMVLDGPAISNLLTIARRLGLEEDWEEALQLLVNQIRSNDISLEKVSEFGRQNAEDLLSYFPNPAAQDLDSEILSAIQFALPAIEATAQSGGKKNTNKYLELIKAFARSQESCATPWSEWAKLAKEAPEASLRQTIEPIVELAGRVAEHRGLHADLRNYLDLMFDLAAKALASYHALKQELGALDFADQEHQLLGLLDHPDVASVLNEELDLLMVDEFQDTSPIQLALFLKLAGFAKQVYWVGDIKQAIYGFRGSDTELMQTILKALPDLGGRKEVLPSSWRSRPELVQLVNEVFSQAFANSLPKEEVELVSTRKDLLPGPPLANWILGGTNADQEASALADGIRKLIDSKYEIFDKTTQTIRPVRYGDVAILSRSNHGVTVLATALTGLGVPVATMQPGLLATPEATLVLACLRRLNDQADTVATAEIVSLADGLEPEIWVAERLNYLKKNGEADLWREQAIDGHPAHPVLEVIAELRATLPVLAPREAVETVIAPIVELFKKDLLVTTVVVTLTYALHGATFYYCLNWLSKLATDIGYTAAGAAHAFAWCSGGGIVGALLAAFLATRIRIQWLIAFALVASTGALLLLSTIHHMSDEFFFACGLVGVALYCGQSSLYAYMMHAFPTQVRASGAGFVTGVGRCGGIASPTISGFLFAFGLSNAEVSTMMAMGSLSGAAILLSYHIFWRKT